MQLFSIKTALEARGHKLHIYGAPAPVPPDELPIVKITLISSDILTGPLTAVDRGDAAYHTNEDQAVLAVGDIFVGPPDIMTLEVTNPIAPPPLRTPFGLGRDPWLNQFLDRPQPPAEPTEPEPDPNSDASQERGPLPI